MKKYNVEPRLSVNTGSIQNATKQRRIHMQLTTTKKKKENDSITGNWNQIQQLSAKEYNRILYKIETVEDGKQERKRIDQSQSAIVISLFIIARESLFHSKEDILNCFKSVMEGTGYIIACRISNDAANIYKYDLFINKNHHYSNKNDTNFLKIK